MPRLTDTAGARVAGRVRDLLAARGLTQRKLARLIGRRESTVSALCVGEVSPTLATLELIADALDVSVDVLLARAPIPDDDDKNLQRFRDVEKKVNGTA